MNIGLLDVDNTAYPNLALMKISAFHKKKGDFVEFAKFGDYDILYKSKAFTFTKEPKIKLYSYKELFVGGIGFNFSTLPKEVEHICPDYSLYQCTSAYGFLTRGCSNKCPWCIVPSKEGNIKPNADIDEFLGGMSSAILMDNNVLASQHGLNQIQKIVDKKIKIDFNQGLDARIIAENKDIAKLLAKVRWLSPLRMACDSKGQMNSIEKATNLLRKYGAKPSNYFVYVLIKEIDDAYDRVIFLKNLKLDPFAQPYRDFTKDSKVDKKAADFARWVNHKAIFKSVEWKDYKQKAIINGLLKE